MNKQKTKTGWNGLLSTSLVLLVLLAAFMGFQISRMWGAAGEGLTSTHNLTFIALFIGVLAALAGLKLNPKYFSLLGVLMCLVLIAQILAFTGLFSLESLFASVAVIFLVLGNLKLRKN